MISPSKTGTHGQTHELARFFFKGNARNPRRGEGNQGIRLKRGEFRELGENTGKLNEEISELKEIVKYL